jgi:hypothetical protein
MKHFLLNFLLVFVLLLSLLLKSLLMLLIVSLVLLLASDTALRGSHHILHEEPGLLFLLRLFFCLRNNNDL